MHKHEPTEETRRIVKVLTAAGVRQEVICKCAGVASPNTLRLHYREELDMGTDMAIAEVAGCLYQNAVEHMNVSAQVFFLKTRGGWATTENLRHSDPNGNPLPTEVTVRYVDAEPHTEED